MEPMRSPAVPAQRQVDVLMLSDLRFPGGTSHSLAEEIAAQAQVGWSTGLVHMNGPLVSWLRPVNPRIREQIRRTREGIFVCDASQEGEDLRRVSADPGEACRGSASGGAAGGVRPAAPY